MTLKQLEAFYWAAKLGTFAIAAQRLHITQSSLSKRIAQLEATLGRELFDRTVKRTSLTSAGETMLGYAEQMLVIAQAARAGAQREHAFSGACHFGVSELSATTWFPAFVTQLHRDHPGLVLKPRIGPGRSLERLVERGELGFAIIAGIATAEALDSEIVAEVPFSWMASPSSRKRGSTSQSCLPLISSTNDSSLNDLMKGWAISASIDLGHVITCNSMTATVGLTVAGVGISCLPREYVSTLVRRQLLVPLHEEARPLLLPYSFVWRRDDARILIREMRDRVFAIADFTRPNELWS